MGGEFVAATILISVFSSTNSVILTAPRVFYAMAKDNLFFKKLAEVHPRFQTPAASVISLGVLAAILTQAGKFSELVEGVIFVGWIFYGLAGAAIFPLRRKLGGKTLPYQVPGYPWTPILFVLSAIAIVGNAIYRATIDPAQFRHVLAALAFLAAGIPAYYSGVLAPANEIVPSSRRMEPLTSFRCRILKQGPGTSLFA